MQILNWDVDKNIKIKEKRGISFEEILIYIEEGKVIDILDNPNYPNQKLMLIDINAYIYVVPFVENKEEIFLKTIYPSRKYTKSYFQNKDKI